MGSYQTIETDVLVVGSEAAGARAAVEAHDRGAKVILCTKSLRGRSGVTLKAVFSVAAPFGYADPADNPDVFFQDTVVGGRHLANQTLTRVYADEGAQRLHELGEWGVNWDKTEDGRYRQVKLYGHTYPRSLSVGFLVGTAWIRCFREQLNKRNIVTMNDLFVQEYLTDENGVISGAFCIDINTSEPVVIKAKSIIDATGGPLDLYTGNTGTPECSGDGLAMAYRLGAELVDMEFVQFYPIALYQPPGLYGDEAIPAMVRLWLRGHLYNYMGERFMERYDPSRMELADRDVLSTSIWREMKEGRGLPGGGVWLDTSFHADKIIETVIADQAPGWNMRGHDLLKFGLDLRKDPLVVGPVVHFFCGGIKVKDTTWASDIPGLYGCGESVGGVHGANRLPGGALTETQVSGARAGKYAALYSNEKDYAKLDETKIEELVQKVEGVMSRDKGLRPITVMNELKDLMWNKVGILRTQKDLESALSRIQEMRNVDLKRVAPESSSKTFNHELVEVFELENALLVAEAITRAAEMRKESRGNHQRDDFEETLDEWLVNTYVCNKNNKMTLEQRPVITI